MKALRKWKAEQAEERLALGPGYKNHQDLVFTTTVGTPPDLTNIWDNNYRRVMAAAGLGKYDEAPIGYPGKRGPRKQPKFRPAFRIYDLRHTCATLLLQKGENLKVVSERLGHKSISITADTYSYVLPTMQEAAADKLEAMFG